jgi:hypothetical protein
MSKWTLAELSGRADLIVELDGGEGVPAVCRSAVEELGMRGLLPPAVTVTDMAASRDLGNIADGTVRCSVHWVAGVEGHTDLTDPRERPSQPNAKSRGDLQTRYVELQRLAMYLLDKLGGSVTITEREQGEVDFDGIGMEIHTWRNPETFAPELRLVRRNRDIVEVEAEVVNSGPDGWPDVWSEYQRFFDRLGMDEDEARELIASALQVASRLGVATDADALADALKEFVVLRDDRDPAGADMRSRLASALLWLGSITDADEKPAAAMHLFGTRGETLHQVLAEMRIDVPQVRDIVMSRSTGVQGTVHRVEGDRVQVWWSVDDASWESPAGLTVISKEGRREQAR